MFIRSMNVDARSNPASPVNARPKSAAGMSFAITGDRQTRKDAAITAILTAENAGGAAGANERARDVRHGSPLAQLHGTGVNPTSRISDCARRFARVARRFLSGRGAVRLRVRARPDRQRCCAGARAEGTTPVDATSGGGTVVKHTSLALAMLGTLGLAAGPNTAFGLGTTGSEPVSALVTGAVLLLLAAAARRAPVRKD
jgi:hypothetical protein